MVAGRFLATVSLVLSTCHSTSCKHTVSAEVCGMHQAVHLPTNTTKFHMLLQRCHITHEMPISSSPCCMVRLQQCMPHCNSVIHEALVQLLTRLHDYLEERSAQQLFPVVADCLCKTLGSKHDRVPCLLRVGDDHARHCRLQGLNCPLILQPSSNLNLTDNYSKGFGVKLCSGLCDVVWKVHSKYAHTSTMKSAF